MLSFFRLSLSPFGYLNCTQFLGAMNDNIFKLLTVFCFIAIEGSGSSNSILASVGALYVLPFLFLSSTSGTMADKFSKRSIIVATKIAECVVMVLGMWAFAIGSKLFAYTALFLLACHSAIFAPCKYGIVPELVPPERISKANGILTSCTYIAIIVGTFLASFLTDISNYNFIIASSVSVFFAIIGLFSSLKIPRTAPSGSKKPISIWFISELFKNIVIIYKHPSLLSAVVGSAFFLFVGSYSQLNMIPFAIENLHLTDVQGGYLFLLTAMGIGLGALLAGKISGKTVEIGLVPFGGLGIALCLLLISFCTESIITEIVLITLIGIFGGFYLVPLDAFIQVASPKTIRGQVIATSNFLGFFGVLCSAGMLYFLSEILGIRPSSGFFVIGCITLVIVSIITIAIWGYFVRFWCEMITNWLLKKLPVLSQEIPKTAPSVLFCNRPVWPWFIALVGGQQRRVRVFTLKPSPWHLKAAQYLLSIHTLSSIEIISPGGKKEFLIRKAIERGTSIALFCEEAKQNQFREAWSKELKGISFFNYNS